MSTVKETNGQNNNSATQKMMQQTLDANGNVTQSKPFDYGNAITRLKTYTNTLSWRYDVQHLSPRPQI